MNRERALRLRFALVFAFSAVAAIVLTLVFISGYGSSVIATLSDVLSILVALTLLVFIFFRMRRRYDINYYKYLTRRHN